MYGRLTPLQKLWRTFDLELIANPLVAYTCWGRDSQNRPLILDLLFVKRPGTGRWWRLDGQDLHLVGERQLIAARRESKGMLVLEGDLPVLLPYAPDPALPELCRGLAYILDRVRRKSPLGPFRMPPFRNYE